MFDYHRWRDVAPIECVVNIALLYTGERDIVQLDVTYYDDPTDRENIERLVAHVAEDCVEHRDRSGNIILYLSKNATPIEQRLRETDGTIDGGFGGTQFSRLLDPSFYTCTADLKRVFKRVHLVRVSIDVIHAGRSGAILVQMLSQSTARKCMKQMQARFQWLSRRIEQLDPTLHTSFTMYSKPGYWKEGPEYIARNLTTLT